MDTPIVSQPQVKRCLSCQQEYPFTGEYFHRSKRHPGGLYPVCKTCKRAAKRTFDASHREQVNERERLRQDAIRDQLNADRRQRHADNPEAKREADQRYYHKNKDKIQRRQLKWGHQNPHKKRAIGHRYLARKRALPNDFTGDDWQHALDYWRGVCAYCGNPPGLWNRFTAEHYIPVTDAECPGTTKTNILPACQSCNSSKNDTLPDVWLPRKFGKHRAAAIQAAIDQYFGSL
jgi:5-methylcytosine-specific restriction endonuclease McrA